MFPTRLKINTTRIVIFYKGFMELINIILENLQSIPFLGFSSSASCLIWLLMLTPSLHVAWFWDLEPASSEKRERFLDVLDLCNNYLLLYLQFTLACGKNAALWCYHHQITTAIFTSEVEAQSGEWHCKEAQVTKSMWHIINQAYKIGILFRTIESFRL